MSQTLQFPRELFFRKNYVIRFVHLSGSQPLVLPEFGDFLDVLDTNADLSRVYVAFNFEDSAPRLKLSHAMGVTTPFSKIFIRWEPDQEGKYVVFIIGRELSFRVFRGYVTIASDTVGLARESTQLLLHANDYNILNIDLGVARTDTLIADRVVTLWIASYTSGATFNIKLFDPSKPPLTQSDLPPGTVLERLRLANVYMSNTAQPGYSLRLIVFRVI